MTEFPNPTPPGDESAAAPSPGLKKSPLGAKARRLLGRLALPAVGLALAGGFIYAAASGESFIKQSELAREKENLEAEIAELQYENRLLREKLERLKSDPDYVEDEARRKLGLVRPGETVYRLSEEPDLADHP